MQNKSFLAIILFLLLSTMACTMPLFSSISSGDLQGTQNALNATALALGVQQTVLAMQQSSNPQGQPQPLIAASTPTATATTQIFPTSTSTPQDINSFIATAKVLIYEDVAGTSLVPIVKRAADFLGLKNYTHVGDDIGKFMQLASGTTAYDLIVVAAEDKAIFKGELFDSVIAQMDRGASLVVEVWYLDKIINGRVRPLMDRCGVDYYQNWVRNAGYNRDDYVLFWIEPTNPIFNTPFVEEPFYRLAYYWSGDVGDLMELTANSTAHQLAAPLSPYYTRDHGVLYSCIDGRMILQTFSTHDYAYDDMLHIWENYMYNTLKARMSYIASHP
jgi:hypothetical protein